MKFKVRSSGNFYSNEEAKKLKALGFKFEDDDSFSDAPKYKESENSFEDGDGAPIEINTLEELMEFIDTWGEIVLNKDMIEIYDNYRE